MQNIEGNPLSDDRRQIPDARGPAVTYSRIPPEREAPGGGSARVEDGRIEPHLTAEEVPHVGAADRLDGGDLYGIEDVDAAVEALSAPRRPRWLGIAALAAVLVVAVGIGVLAMVPLGTGDHAAAPVTTPAGDIAAQILQLRQQIDDLARTTEETVEAARVKTAELRKQLTDLEESQAANAVSTEPAADAPATRDVTFAKPVAEPAATSVAAIPPVPRARPDVVPVAPAVVEGRFTDAAPAAPVVLAPGPAPLAPPATAAAPPADDSNYVKSIEKILASTPDNDPTLQPAPGPSALGTAAPGAGALPPGTEPPPITLDPAAADAAPVSGDERIDEEVPIPPEPIPNPPPAGGVQ